MMDVENLIWQAGLRRGLRSETIKTYVYAVSKFLRTYQLEPHQVTKGDIERHLVQLIKWNRAGSTINVYLHALQFFYREVLGKRILIRLPPIKSRKRLPESLSQEEMSIFLTAITNSKHKLIIFFTYGSGFRVSETVNLKVRDLDLGAGYGWIRDGKGGRSRLFIIPERLKPELQRWVQDRGLQPEDWLFSGYRQQHYSDSSVRKIVNQARHKAALSHQVTPHILRHSFATHLLENGYSLIEVKELLGHSRIETTLQYAHLAKPKWVKVQSPLDSLPVTPPKPLDKSTPNIHHKI